MPEKRSKWETLGGRLGWAIEQQPPQGRRRGVGLLIWKLEQQGAPGASYASIGSYVKDQVQPPLEFLTATARALGLRPAWLAFNEGAPTEAEEAERRRLLQAPEEVEGGVWATVVGAIPGLAELEPHVSAALMQLTLRSVGPFARFGLIEMVEGRESETAAAIADTWWRIVEEPIGMIGEALGRQVQLDPREFSTYAVAILHALSLSLDVALPAHLSPEDVAEWPEISAPGPEEED